MKRLSRRKKAWLLFGLGNLIPICYVLWMCYGSPRAITISKETTWLTEPLTEDGRYVDYRRYEKTLLGEHDHRNDLWKALVSPEREDDQSTPAALAQVPQVTYVDPAKAVAQGPTLSGDFYKDRDREIARMFAVFDDASDPQYSAIVDANEPWYRAVMTVTPGPVAVNWRDADDYGLGLPITDMHRELVSRFLLRASLAFGRGDFAKGLESVQFIREVAERERTVPLSMTQHVGSMLDTFAINSLSSGLLHIEQVTESLLQECDALRPTDNWNRCLAALDDTRIQWLGELQRTHRTRNESGWFKDRTKKFGRPGGTWFVNRVDFDSVMTELNKSHDAFKPVFAIRDFQKSMAAIRRIDGRILKKWPVPWPAPPMTLFELATGGHNAWLHQQMARVSGLTSLRSRIAHEENCYRQLRLCVRLHIYRRQHGRWPENLEQLLTLDGWKIDKADIIDSYNNQPLEYTPFDGGFVIYSVGQNGKDDTNGEFPDRSDKIGWGHRGNDDQLWPWPDPRYRWPLKKPK